MKNPIRVVDVIKYATEKYEYNKEKYEETKRIDSELVEKARNKWLYRKLPWLFDPRDHGLSSWDMGWFSRGIANSYNDLLKQATYNKKLGNATMYWPDHLDLHEASFYRWCSDNNIPY